MKLILHKQKGSKIFALLALSWLAVLALTIEIPSSYVSIHGKNTASDRQLGFSQNAIAPASESNISLANFSFQQISSKDFSKQLSAALLGYNRRVICSFSQQGRLLHLLFIKYRKSDLLFPAHYFW